MNLANEAWPFLGALSAAVVAGTVSFVLSVLSKEQKTSEFRQAWIDALREDLANFASIIMVVHDTTKARINRGEDIDAICRTYLDAPLTDFKDVEKARLRILFRLNPEEHSKLIERINAIYDISVLDEHSNPGTFDDLISLFSEEAQRVLKSEWKRVKRGEPIFRATKWVSILFVIAGILIASTYVYKHIN